MASTSAISLFHKPAHLFSEKIRKHPLVDYVPSSPEELSSTRESRIVELGRSRLFRSKSLEVSPNRSSANLENTPPERQTAQMLSFSHVKTEKNQYGKRYAEEEEEDFWEEGLRTLPQKKAKAMKEESDEEYFSPSNEKGLDEKDLQDEDHALLAPFPESLEVGRPPLKEMILRPVKQMSPIKPDETASQLRKQIGLRSSKTGRYYKACLKISPNSYRYRHCIYIIFNQNLAKYLSDLETLSFNRYQGKVSEAVDAIYRIFLKEMMSSEEFLSRDNPFYIGETQDVSQRRHHAAASRYVERPLYTEIHRQLGEEKDMQLKVLMRGIPIEIRKLMEKLLIEKTQNTYPYGLNTSIGGFGSVVSEKTRQAQAQMTSRNLQDRLLSPPNRRKKLCFAGLEVQRISDESLEEESSP